MHDKTFSFRECDPDILFEETEHTMNVFNLPVQRPFICFPYRGCTHKLARGGQRGLTGDHGHGNITTANREAQKHAYDLEFSMNPPAALQSMIKATSYKVSCPQPPGKHKSWMNGRRREGSGTH